MKIIKSTNKSKLIMLNNMGVFVPNKNKIDIIKNISKVVTGNTPSLKVKKYWSESNGFKWFSTPNFKDSVSGFLTKGSRFLTKDGASVSRICPMGTVIVSCIATVGEVAILNEDSAFNQQINGILPSEKINSLYLRYIFIYQKNNLINYAPKNVIMNINKSLFENYQISYNEDIKQQENIAYVLSTQEEQIERIKGLIKKLEKRNQYYAEKLLSGELRIRENAETGEAEFYENEEWQDVFLNGKYCKIPNEWIISNFSDIMDIKTGKKNANIAKDNGKYLFFTCSKEDSFTDSYSFDQEAILVAGNGNVGHSKYFKGKFEAYQRTYVLGNFKVNGKYINEFIKSFYGKYIKNEVKGGVIPYIKINDLLDFQIILPKNDDIDFTMKFIETLNEELEKIKNLLSKEEKRFQWMLDNLLSGEYEVVED